MRKEGGGKGLAFLDGKSEIRCSSGYLRRTLSGRSPPLKKTRDVIWVYPGSDERPADLVLVRVAPGQQVAAEARGVVPHRMLHIKQHVSIEISRKVRKAVTKGAWSSER